MSMFCSYAGCDIVGTDVVFVLDHSKSIKRRNWPFIVNFTASASSFLNIGLNNSLVGTILFGGDAYIHFNVRQYPDKASLLEAIYNTEYNASKGTSISLVLNLLRVSSQPNGAMMLREGFPHIAVVVTDGRAHDTDEAMIAAQKLHDAKIFDQVHAVGIGRKIREDELRRIASDPSLVNFLTDFEESLFVGLQQNLRRQVCNICKLKISSIATPAMICCVIISYVYL